MKQLMVISHDTYASGLTVTTDDIDSLASLAVGAFAVIDKDETSNTYNHVLNYAAASEADLPAKFQIVTMTSNGLKQSPIIIKANATCTYKAYTAPVAKVMNIVSNIVTMQAGDIAGFIVTDTTKPAHVLSRNRQYIYTIEDGDTEATVIAALIALVNADASRVVNATSGTDIVLTRITAGKNFQISMVGLFRDATVTTTTANTLGHGTAAQVAEYEDACEVEQGNPNYPQYRDKVFTKVSEVDTTTPATYGTYLVRFHNPSQRPILPSTNPFQELLIAWKSSLTAAGNADKSSEALYNLDADLGN